MVFAMVPTHPDLVRTLQTLLTSGDAVLRAYAENVYFDERIGSDRQAGYETSLSDFAPTIDDWREAHGEYLAGAVTVDLPETFLTINGKAALPPAVWSELGSGQVLVRIESLDHMLTHTKLGSLDDLENARALFTGERRDDRVSQDDAKALLEMMCRSLNTNPYANRPRFAAFAQELEADINAPDWANRLRDRLGLAHFPSKTKSGPWPVALMRYTVKEVAKRATHLRANHPLTVPTVLDDQPYEIFHPAPEEANYGRTLHLGDNHDCAGLASEVLHPRIDYLPHHIWKIGAITTRADLSQERLVEMRKTHIECLQLTTERFDFGTI